MALSHEQTKSKRVNSEKTLNAQRAWGVTLRSSEKPESSIDEVAGAQTTEVVFGEPLGGRVKN